MREIINLEEEKVYNESELYHKKLLTRKELQEQYPEEGDCFCLSKKSNIEQQLIKLKSISSPREVPELVFGIVKEDKKGKLVTDIAVAYVRMGK